MRNDMSMEGGDQQPRTIFVVDDDRGLLRLIEKALQREGFQTRTAGSGREAIEWLTANRADLLLLDLKLQDLEGKEIIRRLSEAKRAVPFIIITGQGDERVAVQMMKSGARDYLVKDGDFLQFVPEVVRNVLEQIDTEQRLAAAEERVNLIQSVVERGFSAVLIASADVPEPKVLYINPSFAKLTGYSPDEVIGKPLSELTRLSWLSQRFRLGLSGKKRFVEEVSSYQTAEGERWAEWRIGPVKGRSGRITHWLIILRDITERKQLEKEILEVGDRVQRRIGQDLHDGLCQHLAGIELMSQVLEQKLAARSRADAARVREIARHVREAISQTRLLARGLSPVTLESEGLMSGLKELAENTSKIFSVNCRFDCETPVLVADHAMATHLFRIAQEAVSNAIRHGKASRIVIQLDLRDNCAVLRVFDNGSGLPAAAPARKGMGLPIMHQRAATIGGTLSVANSPIGGVVVTCTVPLASDGQPNGNETKKETGKRQNTHRHRG